MLTRAATIFCGARVFAASPLHPQTKSSDERRALLAVVAQADAEYGLAAPSATRRLSNRDVAVERMAWPTGRIRVYRVLVQSSNNKHPYIVGIVGDRLVRLGGFQAPELFDVAAALHNDSVPISERIALLTLLADVHAAQEFVVILDSGATARAVRARWAELRVPSWPEDTIAVAADGAVEATVTVFSQDLQSFADGFDPIVYRMSFDRNGKLRGWARRFGDRFAAPTHSVQGDGD